MLEQLFVKPETLQTRASFRPGYIHVVEKEKVQVDFDRWVSGFQNNPFLVKYQNGAIWFVEFDACGNLQQATRIQGEAEGGIVEFKEVRIGNFRCRPGAAYLQRQIDQVPETRRQVYFDLYLKEIFLDTDYPGFRDVVAFPVPEGYSGFFAVVWIPSKKVLQLYCYFYNVFLVDEVSLTDWRTAPSQISLFLSGPEKPSLFRELLQSVSESA
jgi:hypothetical protein